MKQIRYIIFDWGNTVMRDLELPGPMKDWPRVECIPGILEALEILKRHFVLVIATSAPSSDVSDMRQALSRVGADGFFTHFFSSRELGVAKPDPDFFRLILDALDCPPADAISVGDKYPNDIAAAKSLKVNTIWFNEKQHAGDFPDADHTIYNMHQLSSVIRDNYSSI